MRDMPEDAPPTVDTPPGSRPRWTWREGSAVAAALVVGVLVGPYVLRASQPLPFVSEDGRVVATGALDAALSTQRTGALANDTYGTTIGTSFRMANGRFCRAFAMNRGPAGLACRERGDWVVEVLARNPRPRDGSAPYGYRLAGTPFPDLIRQAIAARSTGAALTADEETQAARVKWRSERVLKDASP
jgi:hypothetical protein